MKLLTEHKVFYGVFKYEHIMKTWMVLSKLLGFWCFGELYRGGTVSRFTRSYESLLVHFIPAVRPAPYGRF